MKVSENIQADELKLNDLLIIIGRYKWLILFISFLFLFLSNLYLYFKPSIYSTSSVIEVKTRDKNRLSSNDLLQNAFYSTNKELDKEIAVLGTYNINKKVINKMNFNTQFFIEKDYKKEEIYGKEIPLKINNIKILNNKIVGVKIKLLPKENGYSLKIVNSKKDKLFDFISKEKLFHIDSQKKYSYGELIKTDYFQLSIDKIKENTQPIFFNINGSTRNIYESIVNNNLTVTKSYKDGSLIKIIYEDTIPRRATNYINSLVEVFLKEAEINKNIRNNKILNFVKNQLKNAEIKLKNSEKKLVRYKVQNNMINISSQSKLMLDKSSEVEVEISKNRYESILINNILKSIKNKGDFDSVGAILGKFSGTGMLSQLSSLHKLELEENSLSSEYTDEYLKLIKVRTQISTIKKSIAINLKSLKSDIQYKKSNLRKRKQEYDKNLLILPKNEIALANLNREYKVNDKMYSYLLEKNSENEMIKVATISDYKVIEKAYLPKLPIKPKRSFVMLLSLVLGFIVGVVLSIILSNTSSKIRVVEDIRTATRIPLYGIIPFRKKLKTKKIEVFDNSQSKFTESYRKLRTDLQFLSKSKSDSSSAILVTSNIKGEGRSTVVANLSAIFQLAGYKSIVIDLDLRSPSLDKYFDIDSIEGVSGYLNGKDNLSDIIFSTAYPELDIISSGSIPINPSELILSKRLEIMIEKLKESYDYIFVDAPSLDLSMDAINIMEYMDINLVVVKANKSKKQHLQELENSIVKYDLKNIGIVLNSIT